MREPEFHIVIQSRMTSSRLPGKAMMQIRGYPSVVLCALRAANSGLAVTVATSTHHEDDWIANVVQDVGVNVYRGELNDVLGRYVAATADLASEDFVVRYTADNMFPDGRLVSELIEELNPPDEQFVGYGEGFPYGMGAGAVRVKWLRQASQSTKEPYDREHVMPWVIRNYPPKLLPCPVLPLFGDMSHLRCTMDSLSDYVRICRVFDEVGGDPVTVPWQDLIACLRDLPDAPKRPNPKITHNGRTTGVLQLGTAQLGSHYGIANREGRPAECVAAAMLRTAMDSGIEVIDTARDYGDSESLIGRLVPHGDASRLRVTTKLALHDLSEHAEFSEVRTAVDASVFRSCRELRLQQLPVLLLHRSAHLHAWSGAAWQRLLELKEEGVIGELGVSVYDPAEIITVMEAEHLKHIQLPFNLLDRRWLESEIQEALQQLIVRNGVQVTARSVLLQGLLRLPAVEWPSFQGVDAPKIEDELQSLVDDFERLDAIDLCIAYVRSQSWIHSLVIGAETEAQLTKNVEYVNRKPLTDEQRELLVERLPGGPEHLVNPARWTDESLVQRSVPG